MKANVKELFDYLVEDICVEVECIESLGLTMEGEKVTHVLVMEGYGSHEPSVAFTSGDPSGKHTLYWNSTECENNTEFNNLVDKCLELL